MKLLPYKSVKRIFDLCLAILLLVLAFPVMLIIMISLSLTLGGKNIFFRQERIGLNNRVFHVYKFKTMLDKVDEDGALLPDGQRLFGLGIFLRKSSLDELPQIFNVINGTMSFIGPRPLLVEYLPRYNSFQVRRHEVRPGITGWAQVNGRNSIKWEQKFEYDVWYVDNMSFLIDLRIIMLTFLKIVRSEGINQAGNATMEKFMGSDDYNIKNRI